MSSLEADIDALYQRPPAEFTVARTALARTLKGADAARVKKLPKPTVVPWAVNQLYWRDRSVYERLMKSGEALRAAQIATLKGRSVDLRHATDAHRQALGNAVQRARAIAADALLHPDPDALARTLDAMALSPERLDRPGRLTETLEPAGFEALAGVKPVASLARPQDKRPESHAASAARRPSAASPLSDRTTAEPLRPHAPSQSEKEREREQRQREREEAARRRRAEASMKAAEKTFERTREAEARARKAYEDAQEDARAAERALATARLRLGGTRSS